VAARVIRSQEPTLLEEAQRGKTFSRRLIYRLEPSDGDRTLLTVEPGFRSWRAHAADFGV